MISTAGALLASTKSICENLKFGKDNKKESYKPMMTELEPKQLEVSD